ncbi:AMIN-like domain-containing (lipo)protein, partial [Streptomyces sp. 12297]
APAAAPATTAPQATARTQTPLVVNARFGGHCTYDRLVIDVKGYIPTTTVTRVSELRYDGSGNKVPLAGRYFLEIRMNPAQAHNDAGQSVYKGPKLIKIYLPKLKGLAMTGDFEGYVTFGTAFNTRPEYKTFKLHNPERWVMDVKHANVC